MQFDIPKIRTDQISEQEFLENYYKLERPIVITGFIPPEESTIQELLDDQETRPQIGCVGSKLLSVSERLELPWIVKAILARDDIVLRDRSIRIWKQGKGHRTMLHYDGNSLQGLNWQVSGKKHWTLISPDTPPPLIPFHPYAIAKENYCPLDSHQNFCQFVTEPGDLLFLPRYWFHTVVALEQSNSNVNWVWTPQVPNLNVAIGRRECAILAWRKLIPGLSRLIYEPTSIRNYGGGGEKLSRTYADAVRGWELFRVLGSELRSIPAALFHAHDFKQQARKSRESLI